jgi:hypothetical protein
MRGLLDSVHDLNVKYRPKGTTKSRDIVGESVFDVSFWGIQWIKMSDKKRDTSFTWYFPTVWKHKYILSSPPSDTRISTDIIQLLYYFLGAFFATRPILARKLIFLRCSMDHHIYFLENACKWVISLHLTLK